MRNRRELQSVLCGLLNALDAEAFGWLVLALQPHAMTRGARVQVWPDGLGGFRDRERLDRVRDVAHEYVTAEE